MLGGKLKICGQPEKIQEKAKITTRKNLETFNTTLFGGKNSFITYIILLIRKLLKLKEQKGIFFVKNRLQSSKLHQDNSDSPYRYNSTTSRRLFCFCSS